MYMSTKDGINFVLKFIGKNGFDGKLVKGQNAVLALDAIFQNKNLKFDAQRVVSELRRQKLAEISQQNNMIKFRLTPAGAHRLQKLSIEQLVIKQPTKWDKKWRMVTFDIPVSQSKSRTYFTRNLKLLGLSMAQRSSWVHPYDCFEEVAQLAGYYNVNRYCSFFVVTSLDEATQNKLKATFQL